jgi:hypothetical protein
VFITCCVGIAIDFSRLTAIPPPTDSCMFLLISVPFQSISYSSALKMKTICFSETLASTDAQRENVISLYLLVSLYHAFL